MEEMIFVDTSAWYAAYVPSDPNNKSVLAELKRSTDPVVTSDFVIDETITLLQVRGERQRALQFGKDFLHDNRARVEFIDLKDLLDAYNVFARYHDKQWSFTDCTSYVVMKRLSIVKAMSLDHHFRQMPGIEVVELVA
jgi:predicted nucleic acid-binding protein